MPLEHVDQIAKDWAGARPELDMSGIVLSARVTRLRRLLEHSNAEALRVFGISEHEIQVLATLRRQGPPFELTPTQLYRGLLISSAAMTNRIDVLEQRGWVRRIPDTDDRRKVRVALTEEGLAATDEVMDTLARHTNGQFEALDFDERTVLGELLRRITLHVQQDASADG